MKQLLLSRLAIALFILLLSPSVAHSHTTLISSNPASDSEITQLPSVISLRFGEDLFDLQSTSENPVNYMIVHGPSGDEMELSEMRVVGPELMATVVDQNPASGKYHLTYRVIGQDGHEVKGEFHFSLNSSGSRIASQSPAQNEAADPSGDSSPLPVYWLAGLILIVLCWMALIFLRSSQKESD